MKKYPYYVLGTFLVVLILGYLSSEKIPIIQLTVGFSIIYLVFGFSFGFSDKHREKRRLEKEEKIKFRLERRNKEEIAYRKRISKLYEEIELFEVINTTEFIVNIKNSESKIIDFGGDKTLKDLVKLGKFISNIEKSIEEEFKKIPNLSSDIFLMDYQNLRKKKLMLNSFINYQKELYNTSIILLSNLLENNKTEFYIIYDKFDELGVFNSGFENNLLNKVDGLDDKLNEMSKQLFSIKKQLNYQSVLQTVNTFQLRSINKKLN